LDASLSLVILKYLCKTIYWLGVPVRNFLADGLVDVVLHHSDDRRGVVVVVVVLLDVDELKVPPLRSVLLWNGNPQT
jgi:hypothetical protein